MSSSFLRSCSIIIVIKFLQSIIIIYEVVCDITFVHLTNAYLYYIFYFIVVAKFKTYTESFHLSITRLSLQFLGFFSLSLVRSTLSDVFAFSSASSLPLVLSFTICSSHHFHELDQTVSDKNIHRCHQYNHGANHSAFFATCDARIIIASVIAATMMNMTTAILLMPLHTLH